MRNFIIYTLALIVLCSCGEYQRVQKSNDYNYKFEYAKQAYEQKKYVQAATLLQECISVFKGSDKAEESLYLLAMSNYENHDYATAGVYFKSYYTRYPKENSPKTPDSTPATDIIRFARGTARPERHYQSHRRAADIPRLFSAKRQGFDCTKCYLRASG